MFYHIPPGFQWPWPSWRQSGTWLARRPPCSPTWSLSTLHTAPGTQSGRSGRSRSCASEGVCSLHWSCRHILCSSYQRAACQPQQKWRRWWPTPRSDFPGPQLNCRWSLLAYLMLAKILPTWKLGAGKWKIYMLLWSIFESITCEVYREMIKMESLTTFALQML